MSATAHPAPAPRGVGPRRAVTWPRRTGPLQGLGPSLRLLVRRLRVQVLAWALPLWLLLAVTPPAYEDVYPSLQEREPLVESMRDTAGTRLLYGALPLPGRIGQLVQWETGTYLLICVGLMATLLTCRAMRADEDDGLVEVQRGSGAGHLVPFMAPVLVVWGAVALVAGGAGLVLTGLTRIVSELTVSGAWALAGAVAATGWAFAALAALSSQLCRQAGPARGLALTALGCSFALRVLADESGAGWLRWFTPLAWRDLVRPYSDDRVWPLVVCAGIAVLLEAAADGLFARREYLGGCLPDRGSSRRRWRLGGYADLQARLALRSAVAWSVTVAATSALFGAMTGSVTGLLGPDSATGSYVGRLASGSPVEQFMGLLTVMTVLLVAVAGVQRVTALAADERAGFVEFEVAAGVSRARLFLAQAGVAVVESVVLLALSGGVLAAVTGTQLTDDHAVGRALVLTVSQAPGVLAAIGIALALVGLAPRLSALSWAVLGWSVFAQFFGALVGLPDWAQELSVLGHHLDVIGDPDWTPLAVQTAIGLAGMLAGLLGHRRRDLAR